MLGPPRLPSASRPSPIRCMFTKPTALLACIVLTILWLWLTAHPLLQRPTVVHALRIDVDAAAAHQPHPLAGVLVDPLADAAAISSWRTVMHHLHHQEVLPDEPDDPSAIRAARPPFSCYGVHAQRGRRHYMEDTHAVYLNHRLHYSSAAHEHLHSRDTEEGEVSRTSPWALFGVFDGHGGALASEYVAASLLPALHESLQQHGFVSPAQSGSVSDVAAGGVVSALNLSATFSSTFQQLDREFLDVIAAPQRRHDGTTALVAGIHYRRSGGAEEERAHDIDGADFELVVANLGDCRAVMVQQQQQQQQSEFVGASSTPSVVALSFDHKPELPSERAYVESHPGGFVTPARPGRSLARVQGVLAVSRAIGDRPLKPWVRSEPDVRVMPIMDYNTNIQGHAWTGAGEEAHCALEAQLPSDPHSPDTSGAATSSSSSPTVGFTSPLLLLASDGFWDVFSNEEAGEFALDFLHQRQRAPGGTEAPITEGVPHTPSSSLSGSPLLSQLAHHLVAEAYLRGSMDNLTLMAIDVRCVQRWMREQARGEDDSDAKRHR